MKLALVRQKYTPFGGAERFVDRALSALRGRGINVTVITRQWKGEGGDLAVRICNPFYLGRLWRDTSFSREVQGIIRSGEFALVQSHERIPGCHVYRAGDGVHATWLELRARVQSPPARLATALHPWHRYVLRAEALMFRHPDLRAVICNSRMVKEDIVRRFGVDEDKLHVIHNGVDLDYFHPGLRAEHRARMRAELKVAEGAPVILFVGSGFERKGLPQLIRTMNGLPETTLVVVGKDRHAEQMKALAAGMNLGGRVRFVGGQTDVRPYYAMADVFALPTIYDPFPNAALEALACGLPVLTSHGSGAAELITEKFGAVVDALDVPAVSRELMRLLALEPQATAERARTAAGFCALPDMIARLERLYGALAARPL